MSRIAKAFGGGKAFIAFITGGDPDLETTEKLVLAMAEAGADLIEIGIPFSDPVAEGIVIQEADERALKAGCTTDKLFELVKRIREKTEVPLLFMTYLNLIFTYGKDRFLTRCAECGIDGIIVPDLPFEEKAELADICADHGVDLISMIAPTSEDRIAKIAREAQGFIYCVSFPGGDWRTPGDHNRPQQNCRKSSGSHPGTLRNWLWYLNPRTGWPNGAAV